jgi:hypothetical protein
VDLFELDEKKEDMTEAALSNMGGCDKVRNRYLVLAVKE